MRLRKKARERILSGAGFLFRIILFNISLGKPLLSGLSVTPRSLPSFSELQNT